MRRKVSLEVMFGYGEKKSKSLWHLQRWPHRPLWLFTLLIGFMISLTSDLNRLSGEGRISSDATSKSLVLASWVGLELPSAAEMFGEEAASDSSPSVTFEDEDEDEGDELDASASQEYPESEAYEAYEDPEEGGADSFRKELWIEPSGQKTGKIKQHRTKRDADDKMMHERIRNSMKAASSNKKDADDFSVDDNDDDAWVHDGVDDIQIDPETRKAASQLSYDERSIDSEYEQGAGGGGSMKSGPKNRTKITTITEVIPLNPLLDETGEEIPADGARESALTHSQVAPPMAGTVKRLADVKREQKDDEEYLPASYLDFSTTMRLLGGGF